MKAAVLHEHGETPRYGEFDEPTGSDGEIVVDVDAAGVNHLDLLKASGGFYMGPPPLPSVVGSDGVGRLPGARRVFFDATVAPHGSMAERTLVADEALLDVAPDVDDAVAAALGNSGLAAWLALEWKARMEPGETVLVLGATGAVGSVAVQVAKALGAAHVVAAARQDSRLERLAERGADALVDLDTEDDLVAALKRAAGGGVDVVIDPLWGAPAKAAMQAANHGARYVQVGNSAGPSIELQAPVLRSSALSLLGFVVFHAPMDARRNAYLRLTELAARGEITIDIERFGLAGIETAWEQQRAGPDQKLVVVPR